MNFLAFQIAIRLCRTELGTTVKQAETEVMEAASTDPDLATDGNDKARDLAGQLTGWEEADNDDADSRPV
jgi:hypothetical protein